MTASTTLIKNQKVFFDSFDLSGTMNSVALAYSADQIENTTLGSDTHTNTAGLKTAAASFAGFGDSSTYDSALFASISNTTGKPLSICNSTTLGDIAYFLKANTAKYNLDAKVGALMGYSLDAVAADKLVRGTLMEYQTALTATGKGTARQLVAVAAGQSLYAVAHVFSISGTSSPTLTLTLKSNSTNSFSGAETTRITFADFTAVGSQILSLAGPLTDTWYAFEWTISGTNPSFACALEAGIQ